MIVFPMAGASSRFTQAGYLKPKFMLPIGDGYVFDYAVRGMMGAQEHGDVIFIHRGDDEVEDFILARCEAIGVRHPRTFALTAQSRGQAETVELGLRGLGICAGPLWIFNIDTFRRRRRFLDLNKRGDGYLEVFRGTGSNWSFVLPSPHGNRVQRTSEKEPISNLCCNGMYYFADVSNFLYALSQERIRPTSNFSEYYVAPIYNHLVKDGCDIRYDIIAADDVVFCGVPAEYEIILSNPDRLDALMRDD